MGFNYDRVFIVIDDKGEITGVYKREENAIDSLPDSKRHFPQELAQFGNWKYGRGSTAWHIVEKKVRDSADIPSV